ncbi:hypothetical protein C9I89_05310 [Photobacterium lipolyticum]|uniref:Uncharacterized protein n=1 Tax=Photobacterium lipolyticum TaxID=266810 RepID=A0A2T3N3K3_9GAMM|nr:hypothetical protein C9I89_05310 [Photobacterium lipolyticum]
MIRQNEHKPLLHHTAMQRNALLASEVIQKVNQGGHTSSPANDAIGTLHFSILKKVNTFYLRIFHYTGSPMRKSVTVSLRTSQRYRAVGNADYLKQRLVEGIGSYSNFEDIRATSRTIARTELISEHVSYNWFATDSHQIRHPAPSSVLVNHFRTVN